MKLWNYLRGLGWWWTISWWTGGIMLRKELSLKLLTWKPFTNSETFFGIFLCSFWYLLSYKKRWNSIDSWQNLLGFLCCLMKLFASKQDLKTCFTSSWITIYKSKERTEHVENRPTDKNGRKTEQRKTTVGKAILMKTATLLSNLISWFLSLSFTTHTTFDLIYTKYSFFFSLSKTKLIIYYGESDLL